MSKALFLMNNYIDPSDPDLDDDNIIHAYQTAESIRQKYPENRELQLIYANHSSTYHKKFSGALWGISQVTSTAHPYRTNQCL